MKTAFLHGQVEEEIYMLKPEGFAEKKARRTWFAGVPNLCTV